MERILKILGIAAIIFLLVYWISDISKGCNGSKEINEEVIQTTNQESDSVEIDLEEDIFGDEQSKAEDNSSSDVNNDDSANSKNENVDDFIDYSGDVKEEATTKAKVNDTKASTSKKAPVKRKSVSSGGSYLVVAGSYLIKDNATKMKRKLYNLGYDSEIVNFNLSQYYSVLAGRFTSRKDANEAVTILKRSGIDCYVHRKKN